MKEFRRRFGLLVVMWLLVHYFVVTGTSAAANYERPEGAPIELRCDTGIGITVPHGRLSLTTLSLKSLPTAHQILPLAPLHLIAAAFLLELFLLAVHTPLSFRAYICRNIRPPDP